MFDVQNVSLSYGERAILDGASFKMEDGERAAIIGPNGMGKSTLLKIVAGVIKAEGGSISFPKNSEIGYLPQDLELDSTCSVIEECRKVFEEVLQHEVEMRELEHRMAEVPHGTPEFDKIADRYDYLMHEFHRRDPYSMDSTIGKVLGGLGFRVKDFDRSCTTFSGGWQMRILLAKLLLQNPDILLLDEPTNHLDIESIQWLGEWLSTHEGSVLMVSHERAFMDALVTKVVEVDRGAVIVYRGNYSESLEKRAERREMQRRTHENQKQEIAHAQKFIDRFRYQASKAAMVQSRVKRLEKMDVVDLPTPELGTISFQFPPAPRSAKEVVIAEGIARAYGEMRVLDTVDFQVYRGEKVALVGVNGAGKSTMMRIVAGRDRGYEGTTKFGSNVEMAYFAQYDIEDLHPENTVLGEFMSVAPLGVSDRARSILGAFLFSGDDVEKKIKVLSGGERTRLRLAKMLGGRANLLLLDEPTNHLDIGSRLTLEEALRQYDGAVVLVSHDRYFLDAVVTRVVEVRDGKLTSYPGNYTEYLAMREMREARAAAEAGTARKKDGDKKPDVPAPVDPAKLLSQINSVPKKDNAADRKERQERARKAKNRLRKAEVEVKEAEERVARLEAAIGQVENDLASPKNSSDYGKLSELGKKLDGLRAEREAAESQWLGLQEEIETLEKEIEEGE